MEYILLFSFYDAVSRKILSITSRLAFALNEKDTFKQC